jgi:hypothetical protein
MTEYVQLPIFDEKGMQTGDVLIIEVQALQATCGFRARVTDKELYDQELVRQEIEQLDRIVHGLPVKASKREFLGEWTKAEEPVDLLDVVSAYPHDEWRDIPGFSKYQMHGVVQIIREKGTDKDVHVIQGRLPSVLISDDNGVNKRMLFDFLLKKTFPELNI